MVDNNNNNNNKVRSRSIARALNGLAREVQGLVGILQEDSLQLRKEMEERDKVWEDCLFRAIYGVTDPGKWQDMPLDYQEPNSEELEDEDEEVEMEDGEGELEDLWEDSQEHGDRNLM